MTQPSRPLNDEELVARIREALDQSLSDIDSQTVQRLDSARAVALQTDPIARSGDEETLVQIARITLGDSQELNPDIEHSLDEIRFRALARMPANRDSTPSRGHTVNSIHELVLSYWKLPAGVLASAFVLVTSISLFDSANAPETLSSENELALIASADEMELYENLEFYLWLSDNELVTQ